MRGKRRVQAKSLRQPGTRPYEGPVRCRGCGRRAHLHGSGPLRPYVGMLVGGWRLLSYGWLCPDCETVLVARARP